MAYSRFTSPLEEDLRKLVKLEDYKNKLRMLNVPQVLIDLSVKWEDKNKDSFVDSILRGTDISLAFSNELTSMLLEETKQLKTELTHANKRIDDLIQCNDMLEESCEKYFEEVDKLKNVVLTQACTSQAENILKDTQIKALESMNKYLEEKLQSTKATLFFAHEHDSFTENKLKRQDEEIKRLKQEVNSKTWGKNKPYDV